MGKPRQMAGDTGSTVERFLLQYWVTSMGIIWCGHVAECLMLGRLKRYRVNKSKMEMLLIAQGTCVGIWYLKICCPHLVFHTTSALKAKSVITHT